MKRLSNAMRGVLLTVVAACSGAAAGVGPGDSTFVAEGDAGGDAGFTSGFGNDSGPPSPPDAGATDGAVATCTPALPATFAPQWRAPVKAAHCSLDELGGYYDACAGDLRAELCTGWITAHKDCATCIAPADDSGPVQPYHDRLFYTLNIAGCISLVQGAQGGGDTCAIAWDTAFQCRRQSCDGCFDVPQPKYSDFQTCQTKTTTAGCKTYETTRSNACVGYKDPVGGAPQCFPTAAETAAISGTDADAARKASRAHASRVAAFFCGP